MESNKGSTINTARSSSKQNTARSKSTTVPLEMDDESLSLNDGGGGGGSTSDTLVKLPAAKLREKKRKIISLQTMLRAKDLSKESRQRLEKQIAEIQLVLQHAQCQLDTEEIMARRAFLANNPGLFDIFLALWLIFAVYTDDAGVLTKDGYFRFNHALLVALLGISSTENVEAAIENDWQQETAARGAITQAVFFDVLFEVIDTWTEILDPTYLAAFAWSLLDAIADTAATPPKLRPLREIRCITKLTNEAAMIQRFLKNRRVRAALSIETELLARIPDVQRRLLTRKKGVDANDAQRAMIEALALIKQPHDGRSGGGGESDSDGDGDEAPPPQPTLIELIAPELGLAPPPQPAAPPQQQLPAVGVAGGESDASDDDADDYDAAGAASPSHRAPRRSQHRRSTLSFMSYIASRRESKLALNGALDMNSFVRRLSVVTPQMLSDRAAATANAAANARGRHQTAANAAAANGTVAEESDDDVSVSAQSLGSLQSRSSAAAAQRHRSGGGGGALEATPSTADAAHLRFYQRQHGVVPDAVAAPDAAAVFGLSIAHKPLARHTAATAAGTAAATTTTLQLPNGLGEDVDDHFADDAVSALSIASAGHTPHGPFFYVSGGGGGTSGTRTAAGTAATATAAARPVAHAATQVPFLSITALDATGGGSGGAPPVEPLAPPSVFGHPIAVDDAALAAAAATDDAAAVGYEPHASTATDAAVVAFPPPVDRVEPTAASRAANDPLNVAYVRALQRQHQRQLQAAKRANDAAQRLRHTPLGAAAAAAEAAAAASTTTTTTAPTVAAIAATTAATAAAVDAAVLRLNTPQMIHNVRAAYAAQAAARAHAHPIARVNDDNALALAALAPLGPAAAPAAFTDEDDDDAAAAADGAAAAAATQTQTTLATLTRVIAAVRQSTASEMQRNAMRLLTTNQKKLLGYTADAQLQQRQAAATQTTTTAKLTPLQAYHLREAERRRSGGFRRGGGGGSGGGGGAAHRPASPSSPTPAPTMALQPLPSAASAAAATVAQAAQQLRKAASLSDVRPPLRLLPPRGDASAASTSALPIAAAAAADAAGSPPKHRTGLRALVPRVTPLPPTTTAAAASRPTSSSASASASRPATAGAGAAPATATGTARALGETLRDAIASETSTGAPPPLRSFSELLERDGDSVGGDDVSPRGGHSGGSGVGGGVSGGRSGATLAQLGSRLEDGDGDGDEDSAAGGAWRDGYVDSRHAASIPPHRLPPNTLPAHRPAHRVAPPLPVHVNAGGVFSPAASAAELPAPTGEAIEAPRGDALRQLAPTLTIQPLSTAAALSPRRGAVSPLGGASPTSPAARTATDGGGGGFFASTASSLSHAEVRALPTRQLLAPSDASVVAHHPATHRLLPASRSPVVHPSHATFLSIRGATSPPKAAGPTLSIVTATTTAAMATAAAAIDGGGAGPAEGDFPVVTQPLPLPQFTCPATKVPWLPRGTLTPLDHDRSDALQGWKDKLDYLRHVPVDAARPKMSIVMQRDVRRAFEAYAHRLTRLEQQQQQQQQQF